MFQIVEDIEICENSCRYSSTHEHVLWDVGYFHRYKRSYTMHTKICTQHEIGDRTNGTGSILNTEHVANFERRES